MGVFQQQQENSLFIYHDKIATQIFSAIEHIGEKDVNRESSRSIIIGNIVYARSLVEGVDRDERGMPKLDYMKNLENEKSLFILIAEMVHWQKQAKLTPQIINTFNNSTYQKALERARKDDIAQNKAKKV